MKTLSRAALSSLAALALGLATGSAAFAGVSIGQAPPGAGTPINCGPGVALQASVGSGSDYVVPAGGGVITSWSTSLTGQVDFATFRGAGTSWTRLNSFPGVGTGVLTSFPVRVPVQPGDRLGLVVPGATPGCAFQTGAVGDSMLVVGAAPVGTPTMFTNGGSYRANVAAVVEPDADSDGYGDETQDFCPSRATQQSPCEPKPAFTKTPKKKTTQGKASFTFTSDGTGVTFTCAVDGGAFTACSSPFTKKFKPGKHAFQVQATDVAGNRSVPISYQWTVKKKKRR